MRNDNIYGRLLFSLAKIRISLRPFPSLETLLIAFRTCTSFKLTIELPKIKYGLSINFSNVDRKLSWTFPYDHFHPQ